MPNANSVARSGECRADNQKLHQPSLQPLLPQTLFPSCSQETRARNPFSHSPNTPNSYFHRPILLFDRNPILVSPFQSNPNQNFASNCRICVKSSNLYLPPSLSLLDSLLFSQNSDSAGKTQFRYKIIYNSGKGCGNFLSGFSVFYENILKRMQKQQNQQKKEKVIFLFTSVFFPQLLQRLFTDSFNTVESKFFCFLTNSLSLSTGDRNRSHWFLIRGERA